MGESLRSGTDRQELVLSWRIGRISLQVWPAGSCDRRLTIVVRLVSTERGVKTYDKRIDSFDPFGILHFVGLRIQGIGQQRKTRPEVDTHPSR